MPATKRRRLDGHGVRALAFVKEMVEGGPAPKRRRRVRNDEESCDTAEAEERDACMQKESTLQYNLVRALDHQLTIAVLGGLQAWIADSDCSRMLAKTEWRAEVKNRDPFESHEAAVWQRFKVNDAWTD